MENTNFKDYDTIEVFQKCGTCSRTFGHLLNREFGYPKDAELRALDPFAGGLMNQGYQCGMLWGSALAVGIEAYRKYTDPEAAKKSAITATQHILRSFQEQTNTLDCKEIIGINLSRFSEMMNFIVKTTIQGTKNNQCYNLAEQWAPDAFQSAREGLAEEPIDLKHPTINCASEVAKRMGANEEEQVMVAGFAGGLGLSGKACGALSAAIWFKTLEWCKDHPDKNPPYFNNKPAKKILRSFKKATDGKFLCTEVSGQKFQNIAEHSKFINMGGCEKLMRDLIDL